jgi:hypothetical protein
VMPSLLRTQDADVESLLLRLRQHERRCEHAEAISVCTVLARSGHWRPVQRLAHSWLFHASSTHPPKIKHPEQAGPFSRLARHAANVYRVMAPIAGLRCQQVRHKPGFVWEYSAFPVDGVAPNPLRFYVRALKLWWPNGWNRWLQLTPEGRAFQWSPLARIGYERSPCIWQTGEVKHGKTCPLLPEVPELPT